MQLSGYSVGKEVIGGVGWSFVVVESGMHQLATNYCELLKRIKHVIPFALLEMEK